MVYNTPENDPYNREMLIAHYNKYNRDVQQYFSKRPDKLLVVNLKDHDADERIHDFLGLEGPVLDIPWKNKIAALPIKRRAYHRGW